MPVIPSSLSSSAVPAPSPQKCLARVRTSSYGDGPAGSAAFTETAAPRTAAQNARVPQKRRVTLIVPPVVLLPPGICRRGGIFSEMRFLCSRKTLPVISFHSLRHLRTKTAMAGICPSSRSFRKKSPLICLLSFPGKAGGSEFSSEKRRLISGRPPASPVPESDPERGRRETARLMACRPAQSALDCPRRGKRRPEERFRCRIPSAYHRSIRRRSG